MCTCACTPCIYYTRCAYVGVHACTLCWCHVCMHVFDVYILCMLVFLCVHNALVFTCACVHVCIDRCCMYVLVYMRVCVYAVLYVWYRCCMYVLVYMRVCVHARWCCMHTRHWCPMGPDSPFHTALAHLAARTHQRGMVHLLLLFRKRLGQVVNFFIHDRPPLHIIVPATRLTVGHCHRCGSSRAIACRRAVVVVLEMDGEELFLVWGRGECHVVALQTHNTIPLSSHCNTQRHTISSHHCHHNATRNDNHTTVIALQHATTHHITTPLSLHCNTQRHTTTPQSPQCNNISHTTVLTVQHNRTHHHNTTVITVQQHIAHHSHHSATQQDTSPQHHSHHSATIPPSPPWHTRARQWSESP